MKYDAHNKNQTDLTHHSLIFTVVFRLLFKYYVIHHVANPMYESLFRATIAMYVRSI